MRAYVVEHPEGAFTKVELPRPAPSAGQVLVRVRASGVNPLDTKIRAGKAAHAKKERVRSSRSAATALAGQF